jgi:hypothetical protein
MKMLIKRIGVIILILAFMSISATSVSAIPCKCGDISVNETGWWRVGGSFNASNTPIQHAVDNVTDGETVCVKDGVYTENVNLNKRLTLNSENGSSSTMVQAATPTTSVIIVAANYVNLSGFMVTGANAGMDTIVATCACETSNDAFKSWESCAITIKSAYGSGTQNDIFQPGESVYATGSGYAASTTYNLYIVDDTTWTDGMLIPARIADTETSVTTDASGNIPAGTLIWSVCVEGKYDIVVDVNGDGDYDAGIDALDTNVDVSFKEIPEFSTIAIPVASILGLLFFFNHRKQRKEQ